MVVLKYYSPVTVFSSPGGMTEPRDRKLAESFYEIRYGPKKGERWDRYDRNAGAVQLYLNNKPMNAPINFISYGNKELSRGIKRERTMYGHSERILMQQLLDKLIREEGPVHGILPPSDLVKDGDGSDGTIDIIKAMMEKAGEYKQYLTKKGFIVKMWSERPACDDDKEIGGGCRRFIESIFPEGSQFGYIVENYTIGNSEIVKAASRNFKKAFEDFQTASP